MGSLPAYRPPLGVFTYLPVQCLSQRIGPGTISSPRLRPARSSLRERERDRERDRQTGDSRQPKFERTAAFAPAALRLHLTFEHFLHFPRFPHFVHFLQILHFLHYPPHPPHSPF